MCSNLEQSGSKYKEYKTGPELNLVALHRGCDADTVSLTTQLLWSTIQTKQNWREDKIEGLFELVCRKTDWVRLKKKYKLYKISRQEALNDNIDAYQSNQEDGCYQNKGRRSRKDLKTPWSLRIQSECHGEHNAGGWSGDPWFKMPKFMLCREIIAHINILFISNKAALQIFIKSSPLHVSMRMTRMMNQNCFMSFEKAIYVCSPNSRSAGGAKKSLVRSLNECLPVFECFTNPD